MRVARPTTPAEVGIRAISLVAAFATLYVAILGFVWAYIGFSAAGDPDFLLGWTIAGAIVVAVAAAGLFCLVGLGDLRPRYAPGVRQPDGQATGR